MTADSEIAEVVARLRNRSLTVCENCGGEGYTDMGKSACWRCYGAGVETPELMAALAQSDLRDALGDPFVCGHSGCEGGPRVELVYQTIAETTRAHDAIRAFLADPASPTPTERSGTP